MADGGGLHEANTRITEAMGSVRSGQCALRVDKPVVRRPAA